jgi:hypothetical protein
MYYFCIYAMTRTRATFSWPNLYNVLMHEYELTFFLISLFTSALASYSTLFLIPRLKVAQCPWRFWDFICTSKFETSIYFKIKLLKTLVSWQNWISWEGTEEQGTSLCSLKRGVSAYEPFWRPLVGERITDRVMTEIFPSLRNQRKNCSDRKFLVTVDAQFSTLFIFCKTGSING